MRFLFACAVLFVSLPAVAKSPRLTLFITVDSFSSDLYLRSKGRFKTGLATLTNPWPEASTHFRSDFIRLNCVAASGRKAISQAPIIAL